MDKGVMDTTDIMFAGRCLHDCVPRYFDGKYMMLEYEYSAFSDESVYLVALVKYNSMIEKRIYKVLCMFRLQQDAMQYIHRRQNNE